MIKENKRCWEIHCDTPLCAYEDSSLHKTRTASVAYWRRQGWLIGVNNDMCPKCRRV
jgi:hypothetical protein